MVSLVKCLDRAGGESGTGPVGKGRGPSWTGFRCAVVCLSLSLLRFELVRAALANHHKTFGGGQGHGQER